MLHPYRSLPRLLARLGATSLALGLSRVSAQSSLYWDTNGDTTGSSAGPVAPGAWSGNMWNATSNGGSATQAWVNDSNAVFAAGINAYGAYTVTLPTAVTASEVFFNQGDVRLQGSANGAVWGPTHTFALWLHVKPGARGTFAQNGLGKASSYAKAGGGVLELAGSSMRMQGRATFQGYWQPWLYEPGICQVDGGTLRLSGGATVEAAGTPANGAVGTEVRVGVSNAGTLEVANGIVDTRTMWVGMYAGSSGTVDVVNDGGPAGAKVWVVGSTGTLGGLHIGHGGNGSIHLHPGKLELLMADLTFGLVGGSGSLTVGPGSEFWLRSQGSARDASQMMTKGSGSGVLNMAGGLMGVESAISSARLDIPVPMTFTGASTLDLNLHTQCRTSSSGTGGFTKTGSATLFLSGTHAYTGDTAIGAGGLHVEGAAAVLSGTNRIVGNGVFSVTGGGTATIASSAQFGVAGGTGTVLVDGGNSTLTTGTVLEIGSSAPGILGISGGGRVTIGSTIALGVQAGSAGTVTVGDPGSRLTSGSTLNVGYLGSGALTIQSGGVVIAGSDVNLGLFAGSTGSLALKPGGVLEVGGANGILRGVGTGNFSWEGGTLRVRGSTLTTTVPMTLTHEANLDTNGLDCALHGVLSGTGALVKTGLGSLQLTATNTHAGGTTVEGGQVVVAAAGALGTGSVSVLNGNLHSTGNWAVDRAITLNGPASSLTSVGYLEIGLGGTGTLAVAGGAQVTSPSSVSFGVLPGGTLGLADVSGAGSTLSCATNMSIGYFSSGGVIVGAGGTVTVGGSMLLAAGPASQGFFNLGTGGTLNIGGADGIAKGTGAATFAFAGGLLKVTGSSLSSSLPMEVTNNPLIDTSGVDCTLSGVLSGPGNLAKTGAGVLALTGANQLTGGTVVWAGTLGVATPTSLGSGPLALNGGIVDLAFSGTGTVQSLGFDGLPQASGTWGSLSSDATHKTARMTGPGKINVLISSLPPTFNPATTAGLRAPMSVGPVNLAAATGAVPPGGVFSGPGVSGGTFDPAVAGYGQHTLTYTMGGSATLVIAVTGGLTLDEEGGAFAPGNLAPGGIAFAKEVFAHPSHSIPHLNDGQYGNSFSWLGTTVNTHAGIRFGVAAQQINRIAFGRDNTGVFTDRCEDYYILQYSADPDPLAPSATWTSIGAVDYRPGGGAGITQPERRHLFSFPTVAATALRIVAAAPGTGIDEIELYPASGLFSSSGLALLQEGGAHAPNNRAAAGIPFAKDVFPDPSHTVAHLQDGFYGNSFSWLGLSADSFVGVDLGGSFTLDRIAFGRDNTGELLDRAPGRYTLQYTTVASPGATTPDASWTTIGILDYQSPGAPPFAQPTRRHLYGFPAVTATGIRLLTPIHAAIDELELYQAAPHLRIEQPVGVAVLSLSTVAFGGTYASAPLTRTFTVSNPGTQDLVLGALTVTGPSAVNFAATAPGASVLAPGASTTFTITYTPAAAGDALALVQLASNEPGVPEFSFHVSGVSLTPTFSPAAAAGLFVNTAAGSLNLFTATGPTPTGGSFSGPGVGGLVGETFDPVAAGYGLHTVTYTVGQVSASLVVSVAGGLVPLAEGGTFAPDNVAPGGIAFAKDSYLNDGPHTVPHLNDGVHGNPNSWIGITDDTFAGVSLGAIPLPVHRVAFGRDNLGLYDDRAEDFYRIEATAAPNPDAATAAWTVLGAVDLRDPAVANPALRHLYSFPVTNATGLRVVSATAGTAIDEIEIYSPHTLRELWRLQHFGAVTNAGSAADGADPDGNGMVNLLEYALGGDPLVNADDPASRPTGTLVGPDMRLTFTRVLNRGALTLTVQSSDNLTDWTDLARSTAGQPFTSLTPGLTASESGTGPSRAVVILHPATAPRAYYRLIASP